MRLRLAVVLGAALLLGGCWWEGPAFYKGDAADAAPIKPGLYKIDVLGDGKSAATVRVAWLPDGSISATPRKPSKDDGPSRLIMVRLAIPGRDLWVVQDMPAQPVDTVSYGLLERRDDTLSAIPFIDCDSTVAIVRAAGGTVTTNPRIEPARAIDDPPSPSNAAPPPTNQICTFRDRESLERALRAYVATDPNFPVRIRLKRIGD